MRVESSKNSKEEVNLLLEEYRPFILACLSRAEGGYIDQSDERFSVGLNAFYEAINSYKYEKGHFLPFCEKIIGRRLIDYNRKRTSLEKNVISFENHYSTNSEEYIDPYEALDRNMDIKSEVIALQSLMKEWGLTFESIYKNSPRQDKLKEQYKEIVREIYKHDDIVAAVMAKRYLPTKRVSDITGFHIKKIERSRDMVILMLLILNNDLKNIAEFIGI